jgi:hypothetical protein
VLWLDQPEFVGRFSRRDQVACSAEGFEQRCRPPKLLLGL